MDDASSSKPLPEVTPVKSRLKVEPKPRITVVEQVYFQSPNHEAVSADCRFSRNLKEDEQPYIRRVKIGPAWTPIDEGWLKDSCIGMMTIRNEEGKFSGGQPTDAERVKMARRVVEMGVLPSDLMDVISLFPIFPGESLRAPVNNVHRLRLCCMGGGAVITITLFPG